MLRNKVKVPPDTVDPGRSVNHVNHVFYPHFLKAPDAEIIRPGPIYVRRSTDGRILCYSPSPSSSPSPGISSSSIVKMMTFSVLSIMAFRRKVVQIFLYALRASTGVE